MTHVCLYLHYTLIKPNVQLVSQFTRGCVCCIAFRESLTVLAIRITAP